MSPRNGTVTVRMAVPIEAVESLGLAAIRPYRERARHIMRAKGPVYLSGLRYEQLFNGLVGEWRER